MEKKKMVLMIALGIMLVLCTAPTAFASEFSDMPQDWSKEGLEKAVVNGLLVGEGDKIRPGDNLTRAEMATIINRTFGATEKASLQGYSDVPSARWYADDMAKAVQMKTFQGSGQSLFPDSYITREEAFVVVARAMKLYGEPDNALENFSDQEQVSGWARDGISSLVANGYVAGSEGRISPKKLITRAEFAKIMDNLIGDYLGASVTGQSDLEKNVMIRTPGITLKDMRIAGDLIIGEGAGNGKILLSNVAVEGRIILRSKPGSVIISDSPGSAGGRVEDYFPLKNNVKYEFAGLGNEYASFVILHPYTAEFKIQQRMDNGGSVIVKVIALKGNRIEEVLTEGEIYYRENLLNKSMGPPNVLLQEPLSPGASWRLADGGTRTIESNATVLDTPYGSYVCIVVKTEGGNGTTLDYYAKDVGRVKTAYGTGEEEISSTLKEIKVNAFQMDKIRFYYPNINDGKYYGVDKEISFKTNEITAALMAEAYKRMPRNLPPGTGKVLTDQTKINRMALNAMGQLEMDMNQAFLEEMNAGAQFESMILKSIAKTFGGYYNAQEVILTVEDRPYSSGHILFQEGETIPVELSQGTLWP